MDEGFDDRGQGLLVVHVLRAVERDEEVLASGQAEPRQDVPRAGGLRALQRDVVHHIADHVHAAGDALAGQVVDRGLRRGEQQARQMIRHDAVHFLGHLPIEGPQARLDMAEGDAHLRRDEGARERRVRVPVDEEQVRALLLQDLLEPAHHVCGLPPVAPAPHAQVVIRPGDVEGIEEHVGHVLVVMLARVDQDLLMVLTDLAAHRRGLDELGSRADDARDFHAASDGSGGL